MVWIRRGPTTGQKLESTENMKLSADENIGYVEKRETTALARCGVTNSLWAKIALACLADS